jgi:hypothetical protein
MDETTDDVDLADAIEALRDALVKAMWDGENSRVRFRMAPIDLTVHVGVTRAGKGAAGIKWHILAVGGERSREIETMQTLRVRLTPVLFTEDGVELPQTEQLISGRADDESEAPHERPSQDPA